MTRLGEPLSIWDKAVSTIAKPLHASQLYDALVTAIYGEWAAQLQSHTSNLPHPAQLPHPLRILLAEDNLVNQQVAIGFLSQFGYSADVAGNGLEVLEAVKRQNYDVIFMDINMPEMDGLAATKALRAHYGNTGPTIIAMTANAMYEDRQRCLDAGMNDYISKPIRISELVAALQRLAHPPVDAEPAFPESTDDIEACDDNGQLKPVDLRALQSFSDLMGEESETMIAELMRLYLKSTPQLVHEFQVGLAQQDMGKIQHAVHTMRSSSAQMGATLLAKVASEIDDLCYQNNLASINTKAPTLLQEYEQVINYLQLQYHP